LELKEHKVFKVHKERFKDIREPVVMEVQQVTSVQQGQHKVHRDLRVHKVLKELKVHKVWFKGIPELKVLKEEQEILEPPQDSVLMVLKELLVILEPQVFQVHRVLFRVHKEQEE
jgi:hypothetical protein